MICRETGAEGRRLIVNADDLGLSAGVSAGIIEARQRGILTSASAMVNIEGALEQIAQVRAACPDLPIGLHLNITTGRPVLPPDQVPTLVDRSGRFYRSETMLARLPDISLDELRAELHAQAERLLGAGVQFDHIDYHEHIVLVYAPFYEVVLELAREHGVPVRQPVPASVRGQVRLPGGGVAAAIRRMVRFALRHPVRAWRLFPQLSPKAFEQKAALLVARGVPAPDRFIDGYFGRPSVERFLAMLQQLPPGVSEVAVHPGRVDEGLRRLGGGYVAEREAELAVLLDPRLPAALAAHQIALTDFSAVRGQQRSSG